MKQHICRVVPAGLLAGMILLAGCEQSEVERLASGSDDNNVSGKLSTLSISLQGIPEYNASDGQTRSSGSNEPLIGEWVKVNTFDATRPIEKSGEAATDEESQGPRIALMELREDTVSTRPVTRGVMPGGVYFRLIAFRKSGGGYVFQSVADYTSNGSSAPMLQQGTMNLPIGGTYRFVAYSFNNNVPLGLLPSNYVWGGTSIYIPNLYNDFLTYDSGDQIPSGESIVLAVSFTHQLCQLTVRINPIAFDYNTFTNCTGVYISQGGNSTSWTVGQDGIAANTNNSVSFNIPDNSTAAVRLVPFASPRPVTVHFSTLTVGGRVANNTEITSSQYVQLVRGRSYTLTVQLSKRPPGIRVLENEFNLTSNGCTPQDKIDLSKLRWAEGNLNSSLLGSAREYVWGSPTDYGCFYTWFSSWTRNDTRNGIDPCTLLKPNIYGEHWRTPNHNEVHMLRRCTDKKLVNHNGVMGMWFMNKPNGLFLPASGRRMYQGDGCGWEPTGATRGEQGGYWSTFTYEKNTGDILQFSDNNIDVPGRYRTTGHNVRCVKGYNE